MLLPSVNETRRIDFFFFLILHQFLLGVLSQVLWVFFLDFRWKGHVHLSWCMDNSNWSALYLKNGIQGPVSRGLPNTFWGWAFSYHCYQVFMETVSEQFTTLHSFHFSLSPFFFPVKKENCLRVFIQY